MSSPATHDAQGGPVAGPLSREYLAVTIVVLALVTIVAFESMAVSTAMPTVAQHLHAVRSYGFAFSAMLTAQLTGIVLAGVWTDRSGPLPGIFTGQALVGIGSALCGFALNFELFLIGRVLTGLGGGLLVVMLYIIAGRIYPDAVRPRLFTLVSAAWVLPSLVGPGIAGALTENASWRWVFWVVVLPVLVTMIGMARAVRGFDTARLHEAVTNHDHADHQKLFVAGIGIALAAGAVQFGTHALRMEWSFKTGLALAGLVGVVLIAPMLVPPGTWRMARGVPSVMCARAIYTAAFYGALAYVPLFLVGQRHASANLAGLAVACGALGWAVGAWWQGREGLPVHRSWLVTLGAMLLAGSFGFIALVAALNWKGALAAIGLAVAGLAMGLGVTTTTVLALELSPLEEQASASSSLQLADVLGSVLGIAAATALFAANHVRDQDNWLFGVIFGLLAVIAAVAIPAGQRIRT